MKKKIIGYTAGVYDLFHVGHLNILKHAKSMCDELVVGLTTDEFTFRRKGKYPIIPYAERKAILESLCYVDRVVPQDSLQDEGFVDYVSRTQKEIGFDVIFKGDDVKGNQEWTMLESIFGPQGIKIVFFPYTDGISSTLIKEKIIQEKSGSLYEK